MEADEEGEGDDDGDTTRSEARVGEESAGQKRALADDAQDHWPFAICKSKG